MKVTVISGSRADYGLLEWPVRTLRADPFFEVTEREIWGMNVAAASNYCTIQFNLARPDIVLLLGDRFEILAAATAAHLLRIPIAHIGGGDVTEGSYDDAMRDCITRMASTHFATSDAAAARLHSVGYRNVHMVGNPGIDFIRNANWKGQRPIAEPYVVVAYYPETIDGTNDFEAVVASLPINSHWVFIAPNKDRGSEEIRDFMTGLAEERPFHASFYESLPHEDFLNLISHCSEFIGNSSAMLYEAPELGVKTRMIGKRQRGRAIPEGDGKASERIARILKCTAL